MPRGHLVNAADPAAQRLQARLVREWQNDAPPASQPVLIEAPGDRFNPSTHLYVIWDEWESLDQIRRSEIIMDAYEETHEPQELLRVTVAMGLTTAEAERLGIRYEIETENVNA